MCTCNPRSFDRDFRVRLFPLWREGPCGTKPGTRSRVYPQYWPFQAAKQLPASAPPPPPPPPALSSARSPAAAHAAVAGALAELLGCSSLTERPARRVSCMCYFLRFSQGVGQHVQGQRRKERPNRASFGRVQVERTWFLSLPRPPLACCFT